MAVDMEELNELDRKIEARAKLAHGRFCKNPPAKEAALTRLKAFREFCEWSVTCHLPMTELPYVHGKPFPERLAKHWIDKLSRLIYWLECDEVSVLHLEIVSILAYPDIWRADD